MRILVIDDDDQESFLRLMEMSGHEASWARSLPEALRVIEHNGEPDLVISDWDLRPLESLTGLEICQRLEDRYPHTGFWIWSGLERETGPYRFFLKDGVGALLEAIQEVGAEVER
jgi:CheY-like chemotaxis protein